MKLKFVATGLFLRVALGSLRPRHLQSLIPGTIAGYKQWLAAKKKKLEEAESRDVARRLGEDIEPVLGTDDEASIAWIGDRGKASKFVLFLHGGGYVLGANPGHLELCWRCYVAGEPGDRNEVAVAVVQYTLCPEASYPDQLRQVCAALSMLLDRGIAPSNIIFGGDSAGGNLTVQLIRHLVEPHPGIPPIMLAEPVAGAFMVSPLVDTRTDLRSYVDNDPVDIISAMLCHNAAREFLRDRPGDMTLDEMHALALPLEGDSAWMARIDSAVGALYVTGGKQEVFADQIGQFAEIVRRQCPGLELRFEMAEHEAHDYILLEGMLGEGFEAMERMQAWASTVL